MKLGIGLWCLQSTTTRPRSFSELYRELVDDARLAEAVGLESLWLSEHHGFYDGYCPALLPAAAAALQATTSLHVATGVLLLPLQDPHRVAAAARELHDQHDGRFELGMGMGYRPVEFQAKQLDMKQRVRRMNESLDIVTAELENASRLWVGVTSPAAARRAGRRGLGLFISGAFSKVVVDELIANHRQAWEDAGCPGGTKPAVGILRNLWVADTADQRAQATHWVRSSYLVYAGLGWGADDTGVDFASQIDRSMDEVEASAIIGSPELIANELATYEGVERVVCRIGYDAPPRGALTEVIERLGADVAPLVSEVAA